MVCAEEGAGELARAQLNRVDVVAARVEAVTRSALGVLVAQPIAHGQQHRWAGEVLARDQLEMSPLVDQLREDGRGDVRLDASDGVEGGDESDRLTR